MGHWGGPTGHSPCRDKEEAAQAQRVESPMTMTMTMHRNTVTVRQGPRCHQEGPHQSLKEPRQDAFSSQRCPDAAKFLLSHLGLGWGGTFWVQGGTGWGPGGGHRHHPRDWGHMRAQHAPSHTLPSPSAVGVGAGEDREGSGLSSAPHTHPRDLVWDNPSPFRRQGMSLGRGGGEGTPAPSRLCPLPKRSRDQK